MAIGKYKKVLDFLNSLIVKSGTSWIFDPGGVLSGDRANFGSIKDLLNNIVVAGTDGDENSSTLNMSDITSYATTIPAPPAPELDVELIPTVQFGSPVASFTVVESALYRYARGVMEFCNLPDITTVDPGFKVVFVGVGAGTADFEIRPFGTDKIQAVGLSGGDPLVVARGWSSTTIVKAHDLDPVGFPIAAEWLVTGSV